MIYTSMAKDENLLTASEREVRNASMALNLNDKVVVVTGGASGVGREMCKQFAAEGAHVVICDVNIAGCEETQSQMQGKHAGLVAELDISKPDAWHMLRDKVIATYGHLDVLCNNAGVARLNNLTDASLDDWYFHSRINIDGPILGCKTFVDDFIAQGHGTFVNTASMSGFLPYAGTSAYTASKFAVVGFGLCLHDELVNKNIKVYTLCPGGIDTPMTQDSPWEDENDRLIPPAEVAERALEAVKANDDRRFIFTHPEGKDFINEFQQSIIAEYETLNAAMGASS